MSKGYGMLDCIDSKCSCPSYTYLSKYGGECVDKSRGDKWRGEKCDGDTDCADYSREYL